MTHLIAHLRGKYLALKYRLFSRNIYIGPGLKIYKKLSIVGKGKVHIGKNCLVAGIKGDNSQYVTIYTHDRKASISIGENARLNAVRISSKFEISIGNNFIAEESSIVDTDFHSLEPDRRNPRHESLSLCRIIIGNSVCIGVRSIIMKGVTIGDEVVVGPGSVVSSSIGSGQIVLGNPAKPLRLRLNKKRDLIMSTKKE